MYPLKNQVCTLEQARQFDEYGLKAESYFVWVKKDNTWRIVLRERWKTKFWTETIYPAFSCAEAGVLLPAYIEGEGEYWLNRGNNGDNPVIFWNGYDTEYLEAEHEAHAKSDLLLHLLKEKIIAPEDLSLQILF